MIKRILCAAAAYMLGNISPALIVSKSRGEDIREKGSGNAGTTNVLRIYGKKAAAFTMLIDVTKGVAAVLLGRTVCGADCAYLCALAVMCGHIWPVMHGFRGGKGVATTLGVLLTLHLPMGLSEAAVAITVIALSRMVSLGSLCAAAALPFVSRAMLPGFFPYALAISAIVIFKHRSNIGRLLRGEESKISFKKKGDS